MVGVAWSLRGRQRCCTAGAASARRWERLLAAVRGGQSRVLVVRGEPGVGKTALLESAIGSASGFRALRAVGVESEMELAFAALQQLCAPLMGRLNRLPAPQQDALGVAFGLRAGEAPDRFLVGLAVLSLLAEVAEQQPLVCVVDDAQWLDRAPGRALAFVGRRLLAESVALVFSTRDPGAELEGFPQLLVEGLPDGDARDLLESVLRVPLDERVRGRILGEARGNPLALLELPRGLTPGELAGGFGLPDAPGLSGRIEDSFRRRFVGLPAETQHLLLVAAAEPVGDPGMFACAAERRRHRGAALPRVDRAARPDERSACTRTRSSALRRVAASGAPPARRPRAAAHRPRDVQPVRHGGVRRARPGRARSDRRARA